MTASDLHEWMSVTNHRSISAACRSLGITRDWMRRMLDGTRPIPRHIALACAAIAHGLPPFRRG